MQAPAYNRRKNFQENGSDRTDHGALNAELDRAAESINALRGNLGALQGDDGRLRQAMVTLASLTAEARAALSVPGPKGDQGGPGPKGDQGGQGPKGDPGPSFHADARDLMGNRGLYDLQPRYFSMLAVDEGLLFFKVSDAPGDWSRGYEFGRGDVGPKGDQGDLGPRGQQGIQGLKGDKGEKGDAGHNGLDGLVVQVDDTTKTASLLGKSSVSVRLRVIDGTLTVVLSTS